MGTQFKIAIILLFLAQGVLCQNPSLRKAKIYAQKGIDSTFVFLNDIKSKKNFELNADLALETYLIEFDFYLRINDRANIIRVLQKGIPFYQQSQNEYLRLYYDIACIKRDRFFQKILESEIKTCIKKAKLLEAPDLLIDSYLLYSKFYRDFKTNDSLRYYLDTTFQIAKSYNLEIKEAQVQYLIGMDENRRNNLTEARKYFNITRDIAQLHGYELLSTKALTSIARTYHKEGQYEKAFRALYKTLKIFEKYNAHYHVAVVNRYLGTLHQRLGNDNEAISKFLLAKEIVIDSLYPQFSARLSTNLGISNLTIGNLKEAKLHLKQSIVTKEKHKMFAWLSLNYLSLGELYLKEGNFEASKIQYHKAISNNEQIKNTKLNIIGYLGLAKAFIEQGDAQTAEKYIEHLLKNQKINITETYEFEALLTLAKFYNLKKEYQIANDYYMQSVRMRDSVMNFTMALKIETIKTDYENQIKQNEIVKLETENKKKADVIKKSILRSRVYLISIFSGLTILLLFLRNIIQSKKAAEKQNKLNRYLHESNRKISESNHQLERFAHMVSHDLKTPLRTITSFSSLLEEAIATKLDEKEKTYFNYIFKSGKRLSNMIEDMLVYAKLDSQNLNLNETDMNLLIENVLSSFSDQISENSITIKHLENAPVCMVDKFKMTLVFKNLISNAIKFSHPTKKSRYVKIDYKESDGFHQFEIIDNGIGIHKTEKNIFNPFIRLNSKDDYQGTGIGLAMCQKIIQKHHGEIWYDSEPEKGTSILFKIKIITGQKASNQIVDSNITLLAK